MKIVKVVDAKAGGQKAFEIIKQAKESGNLNVLGLATGSTPISLYEELIASDLDFTDTVSVNLDEYVGLPAENPQSYHYFMKQHLFHNKPFKQSYVPNGMQADAEKECTRYDQVIQANPIDIQILGIGRNGHIGFNEPGTSFDSTTHKVALTKSTIEANERFFKSAEEVPTHAYSMGIASIMSAKQIILLAYGENKAEAIKNTVLGTATEEVPASVLQNHPNVIVIVDEAAGKNI